MRARPPAIAGSARVDVDHRALQDVGGGALNRQVDGDRARRARADLAVAAGQLRHQPAPPEQRLHHAARARLVERAVDEGAHRREAGEVGVDELLRRLLRDADVLGQRERGLAVEQRVVDDLRAPPQLVLARGRCRRRRPSARCGRGCLRRARTPRPAPARPTGAPARAARSASSRPRSARGRGSAMKARADLAPELGADRDVLQVRDRCCSAGRWPPPPG